MTLKLYSRVLQLVRWTFELRICFSQKSEMTIENSICFVSCNTFKLAIPALFKLLQVQDVTNLQCDVCKENFQYTENNFEVLKLRNSYIFYIYFYVR